MDVSVVVPTRNRSRLLAISLRSVLRQRGVNLEVIVVDEGSTDDTPAVVAAFCDARVRVIRHDVPRGVSTARNAGAADARGEWVAFLDDDDLWAPDKLAHQLNAALIAGREWAYTGSVSIVDGGRIVHGQPPPAPEEVTAALPRYNAIPGGGSNVVVRRETLRRVGPFDTRLRNTEDWEMWIRLAQAGHPAWVCRPLMAYRVHASNSSLQIAEIGTGRAADRAAARHDRRLGKTASLAGRVLPAERPARGRPCRICPSRHSRSGPGCGRRSRRHPLAPRLAAHRQARGRVDPSPPCLDYRSFGLAQ